MASWYDDLLKRQEYQAIQGQPTYKPNAFQEMFTPKGMEYQWQNRPDQGGGEFTGEIEGVYEGDAQDLRMVKPGLSIATPTVPDGTQSNPGGALPVGFDGERSNSTLHGFLGMTRPSPFKGKVPTPRMTMPGLESGLDAVKARAVRGGWIPPEGDPAVVRGTKPTTTTARPFVGPPEPRPGMRGSRLAGPPIRPTGGALELDPTFRAGRGAAGASEPYVPVKRGIGGSAGARRSSRVPFGRGRHSRMPLPTADPFVGPPRPPLTERPFVGPPRPPVAEPFVGPPRPPGSTSGVPLSGGGAAPERFGLRTNIPEFVKNAGYGKTAALLRGLNPAAWGLTGLDLSSAAWGDPTGLTERQGLAAQRYSGNELMDINAQRAMQGLPPLQGQGAGEEGMQDFTEYFIDSRNYGGDNWVGPGGIADYWTDMLPWNNRSTAGTPSSGGGRFQRR